MDSSNDSLIVYGNFQRWLFVLCGGGWGIAMGIEVSLGILLNELHQEWDLNYALLGLIPSFTMIGIFIGSYFWGLLADKKGRKAAFDKLLLPVIIGIAIGVFSPNIWMLIPCYMIVGFGIGGSFTVDGNVFLEYCPIEKQYLLTSISVLSSFGSSLPPAFILFYDSVHAPYQWRLLQGTMALIALAVAIPRFWIKETPSFLISKHRTDEVVDILLRINPVKEEYKILLGKVIEASPEQKSQEQPIKSQLIALFKKPLKKYTFLYLLIWPLTSFTFIGVASFLPVILYRAGFAKTNRDIYETMLYQQLGI
jgi:putative MFS transporter